MSSLPLPHAPSPIRIATPADAGEVCAIYNHFIGASHCTFEEAPVTATEMAQRIAAANAQMCWFVHEDAADGIVGYAYATPWRTRSGYRFSAETSLYVKHGCEGRGIGKAMYAHLVEDLKARGVHALMAGIALPNDASVGLHEGMGYDKVAHFREVGFKFGRWIDVGYWERMLA